MSLVKSNTIIILQNILKDAEQNPLVLERFCHLLQDGDYCDKVCCESCLAHSKWGIRQSIKHLKG